MLNIEKYKEEIMQIIDKENYSIEVAAEFIACEHNKRADIGSDVDSPLSKRISKAYLNWLCEEYKEPILTDKEKEYLSAVIKPFRNDVIAICKEGFDNYEYITIYFKEEDGEKDGMGFPIFKKGTMYKGMKEDKDYTLEELGL